MTDDLPARVAAAAEALEAEGLRPTIARVRERVQASANRVHRALQEWQEQRLAQLQRQRQQALPADASVPPALRAALDALLTAHAQILGQEIDRERLAARSVEDRLAAELKAERAAAREAAAEATESAAALSAAADEAEARAEQRAAEIADLRTQLADTLRRLDVAEARAERADQRADEASAGWRGESVARAVAERRLEEGREALVAAISRAEAAERRARGLEEDADKRRRLDRAEGRLAGLAARRVTPSETARRRSP